MKGAPRTSRPARQRPVNNLRWWMAAIVIAGGLTYANSLSGPFVFDDRGTVLDNPTIRSLWHRDVLFPPAETPVAGRPVVNASFAVNYALDGLDVRGYHIGNIAVHLLCGLLVFAVVRRTLEQLARDGTAAPSPARNRPATGSQPKSVSRRKGALYEDARSPAA